MKSTILILGTITTLFTSCSTNRTTLTYEPLLEEQPKNSVVIKLLDFKDSRHAKDLVGHFRNDYNIPTVKLVARNDVVKWATSSLREELERSGYTVTGSGSNAETEIQGNIYDLYCDTGKHYNGRMTLKIKVKRDGKVIFKKKYRTAEDNGYVWYQNAKSSTRALEMNMQVMNREIIDDLNRNVFTLFN
ncbi:MAG: YajG family lipoprotein [Candidatus Algichlamydia australiensis]|nr:YajG family lipoprotein [Chlamydiales bacterium]